MSRVGRLAFILSLTGLFSVSGWFEFPASDAVPTPRLRPGIFLYAVPEMRDPNFRQTVVLLVDHEPEGTTGVIINRPTELTLSEALPEVKGMKGRKDRLYFGGPVSRERMLVLIRSPRKTEDTVKVFSDVYLTGSEKVLSDSIRRRGSEDTVRVYSGYAGWAPGQLQNEMLRGDWVVGPAERDMIFSPDPSAVWKKIYSLQEQIEIRHRPAPEGPAATTAAARRTT